MAYSTVPSEAVSNDPSLDSCTFRPAFALAFAPEFDLAFVPFEVEVEQSTFPPLDSMDCRLGLETVPFAPCLGSPSNGFKLVEWDAAYSEAVAGIRNRCNTLGIAAVVVAVELEELFLFAVA